MGLRRAAPLEQMIGLINHVLLVAHRVVVVRLFAVSPSDKQHDQQQAADRAHSALCTAASDLNHN